MVTKDAVQAARRCILAQGAATALVALGGTRPETVTWPNGGFPTDQYTVEPIGLTIGAANIVVLSQTATTVTVQLTAVAAIALGTPFLVHGHS